MDAFSPKPDPFLFSRGETHYCVFSSKAVTESATNR